MHLRSLPLTILLTIAAVLLILCSCAAPPVTSESNASELGQPAGKQEPPAEGQTTASTAFCVDIGCPAPDFTLPTSDGTMISLNSLKGKKVILAFLSTDCSSCLEMITCLQQVYANWPREQLEVLAIMPHQRIQDIERWMKLFEVKNPVVLDTDASILNKYIPNKEPGMFFLDSEGVIKAKMFPPFNDCAKEIDSQLRLY
jgi:peroxiredoxin